MEGIWPLVILWILFAVFGSKKKPGDRQAASGNRQSPPALSLQDKFKAAMEELQRAEREATGQAALPEPKPRPAPPVRQAYTVRGHAPKPAAQPRKKVQPVSAPESDESSETVSPEGKADYDDDVEAVIARRREAVARRGVRVSRSIDDLTPEQKARRGGRPDAAIGGQAEHDTWHAQLEASKPAAAKRARTGPNAVLRRYADGTAKGAFILAEILGKPKTS